VKLGSSSSRFASILGLVASCAACEFESYLDGVVRSPAEKCAAADEELVPAANVQLTCPAGSAARVIDAGRPVISNEKGEFEITVAGLDALGTCRVRVQRDGYKPLEASLAELGLRKDRTLYGRRFVTLRLQRSSAAP
jgi:hypothetical protein